MSTSRYYGSSRWLHPTGPPTYGTNALSISALKFYSGFIGSSYEDLSSCTFRDSGVHNFSVKKLSKIILTTSTSASPKGINDTLWVHTALFPTSITSMIHNLNAQFIHLQFGHASHQRILQMSKLGIYTSLQNPIPEISHPFRSCLISKGPRLPCHPNFPT